MVFSFYNYLVRRPPSASAVRIRTLQSPDLYVVERIAPDVLILEIGTNDLVDKSPEVVGSEIENLVRLLLGHYKVRIVYVCHVIPRGHSYDHAASFARHCAFCHPKCLLLGR